MVFRLILMYNRLQEGKLSKANCDGKTKNLPRIDWSLKELLVNNVPETSSSPGY